MYNGKINNYWNINVIIINLHCILRMHYNTFIIINLFPAILANICDHILYSLFAIFLKNHSIRNFPINI